MTNTLFVSSLALATSLAVLPAFGAPVVFSGSGADPAAISGVRDAFRVAIGGGTSVGANGSFGGVRREINWDGVPDAQSAPNNLNADFFNVNSPRGVVFSTPGSGGFQLSANSGAAAVEFGNINPTYPGIFQTFSPQRLFTALGSNVMDVNFFVAGTTVPGFTSAFGSVFTDVDVADTKIAFFSGANFLGQFSAPIANNGLSFLGVRFNAGERITRVRITSGNTALGQNVNDSQATDVVVMDDFIFAEAQAVPEPPTLLLLAAGLLAVGAARKRR